MPQTACLRPWGRLASALAGESRLRLSVEQAFLDLMAVSTLLAAAGEVRVAGFAFRGWAWVSVLIVSVLLLVPNRLTRGVRCRWWLWLPWIVWMFVKTDFGLRDAAQRFFIFLTPLLALWAASTLRNVTVQMIRRSYRLLWVGTLAIYGIAAVQDGSPKALTDWYSVAGTAMTFTLLTVAALAGLRRAPAAGMAVFAISLGIMFVTESRMPVVVLPVLLVFGYRTISLRGRIVAAVVLVLLALALFQMAPVQENLFFSGYGTLGDLVSLDPEVVNLSGRLVAWPMYLGGIENPWLGDGSTASVEFGQLNFGTGKWAHPHNEYIRVLFDYGVVGALLLGVPTLCLLVSLYRRSRAACGDAEVGWLYCVAVNGLIGVLLLGISGNSLMYIAYIGNMLFATIGATWVVRTASTTGEASYAHPAGPQ